MNRITRCPSCSTVYQVGSEHLQAAHGWLQCGQCQHIFDSTGLVLLWAPAEGSAPPSADAIASSSPAQVKRIPIEDLLPSNGASTSLSDEPASSDLLSFEQALSSFKPIRDDLTPAAPPSSNDAGEVVSGWRSPVFSGRHVMAWVLLLVLIVQLVFVQRQTIAAHWPAAGTVVRQVCMSLGCALNPLSDQDGMVIEGSDLVQRGADHFLSWTVRNISEHPLGMTALELSLNDAQKMVWLRRVLLPSDVGAPDVLGPGQSWSGELKVEVDPAQPISDYRLLSFYP
ncbi:hypothetical protein B9Z47_03685 [Limnohabitans sp. 2KL-1]|uniref:zinc-ribbon and DUF3426 domain-containing protein n=1 Tax=Limnohabitans sp. 2KL-1 TaxID=1100699 RepID=UPI000D34C7AA|nr:zinc-ribbon and DUF3426 domain-containing protein [Limnohabitans sp. 2KL-1]PUE51078.1 hypothetical protein B9Z47_03685 [Limnohabitans sp. 2KL-1]